MRIEILIDQEDPLIFPLNKPKIVIGSNESCDIFLSHESVSRKHIIVVNEDENFFVIDQGSTNGSFINEERLVPGRRVEFTSFFPVRLGDKILLTLLSDEDAKDLGFSDLQSFAHSKTTNSGFQSSSLSDATKAISLKELHSSKTESLVKKRVETLSKKKADSKAPVKKVQNDKSRMTVVKMISIIILGFGVYYNFFHAPPAQVGPIRPVAKVGEVVKVADPAPLYPLVDKELLIPREKLSEIKKNSGCISDYEKHFCDRFPGQQMNAIQSGTNIVLFFDGSTIYQRAKGILPPAPADANGVVAPDILKKYQIDLNYVSMVMFLNETMPRDLNYELLKEMKITIVLSIPSETGSEEYIVLAVVPESLDLFYKKIRPVFFDRIRKYGRGAIDFLNDFFIIY
jgi:pSer/pThr/pTyr-binding forkhead associated (FHA) protein